MSETKDLYLSGPDQAYGPYSKSDLRALRVTADTAVRRGERGDWQWAGQDPQLSEHLYVAPPPDEEDIAGGPQAEKPRQASAARGKVGVHWGEPAKADACTKPGYRQYSAILWNVPYGEKWELWAEKTPFTIKGYHFPKPHRYKVAGHLWGEWDVPDSSCGSADLGDVNAVVFLKPEIPVNLGHVGWGIKMSSNQWLYGAKELAKDIYVAPGKPNGVFTRKGTAKEMIQAFRNGGGSPGPMWSYKCYKTIKVSTPHPDWGEARAEESKGSGYALFTNNCMDDAVKIINSYAGYTAVPLPYMQPPTKWVPNVWFWHIPGPEYQTSQAL